VAGLTLSICMEELIGWIKITSSVIVTSHIMHYINLLTYLFLFLHVVSKAFNYIVLSSCNIVAQMLHWSLSNGRLLSSDHLLSILNCYSSVLCNSQLVTLLSDRESTSFVCSAAAAVHAFVCSRELCTTL